MASSSTRLLTACAIASLLPFVAAADDSGSRWIDVEFSRDSPVLPISFSLGPGSTAGVRGTSMAFELHASLLLRNTGTKPLSGLTLRVEAKDLTPSGKGSVSIPSLQIAPGEVFPVRIDMELLRPFTVMKSDGAVFQLSLDCALFADMTSYGPDKLGSKRALMVYELEARRDRQYLAELLRTGRIPQLREELNFGLQDVTPQQLGLELLRDPLSDTRREQALNVQAVSFASAPVQPLGGAARVVGNQVRSPQIEVRNTSQKAVRSIAMGWIVRDERGRDFLAGSVPAAIQLAPVQTGTMTESGTLRFSHPLGQPMSIEGLTAFINDVEFADGKLWIPSRADIQAATPDPVLRRALVTSPEQQRLAEIYRRKGVAGLAEALRVTN
jgi:hypothetical protein